MSEIMMFLVQCGIIAVILTAGAWAWESSARWSVRPARWGWLAALGGSVALPFVLRAIPSQTWSDAMPSVGVVRLDGLSIAAPSSSSRAGIDIAQIGIVLWVVLSLLVASYVALLLVRLARARRGWRDAELDGDAVLVSRNLGPAAFGVRRGVVVIPSWALQLDAGLRRLMLLHEKEHVNAGDPRVLFAGLGLFAVMPWNPLVWLQLLRLRNAIELDCDARVLGRGVDPTRYGSLLLEVGRRRGGSPLVLATFAEPRIFLEERIRRIARWPLRPQPVRAAVLSLVALALFSTALLARVRVESVSSALTGEGSVMEALGLPGVQIEIPPMAPYMAVDTPPPLPRPDPRGTPYTKAPSLKNTDALIARMEQLYPAQLRERRVSATVNLWLLVDDRGQVRQTQVAKSSGYPALDSAGIQLGGEMQFAPAELGELPVQAWVEVPVAFGQLAYSVVVNGQPLRVVEPKIDEKPTFTPMTVRPELRNASEVQRTLIASYPPALREAGIGGTSVVWFLIDDTGGVAKTQISKSSGYPALDDAALRVAGTMQFSPAMNRDQVTKVWVEIPIMFTAKEPDARLQGAGANVLTARGERVVYEEVPVTMPARTPAPAGRMSSSPATNEVRRSGDGPVSAGIRVRPAMTNPDQVQASIVRSYPPLLRDAGIRGTAILSIDIDEEGVPRAARTIHSSGFPALDAAAMDVVQEMRFSPARVGPQRLPTTVELPISFGEPALRMGARREGPTVLEGFATAGVPVQGEVKRLGATSTMTQRPELTNGAEAQRALIRSYPPTLRDAGIGGTTGVWFFINEQGEVAKVQISKSSGYPALDEAALRVVEMMRFKPAMNREQPVAGWFDIPILFTPK